MTDPAGSASPGPPPRRRPSPARLRGVPPRGVRRPLAVAVLLAALVGVVTALPVVAVASGLAAAGRAVAALRPGQGGRRLPRWRALRLVLFAEVWLALEVAALVAALVLWLVAGPGGRVRSPRSLAAHRTVLRVVLHAVGTAARVLFRLRVVTVGTSWSPLDDGVPGSTNAMVVLSRHAGPGDSVLLVDTLMDRDHLRRPRIVLKGLLRLDPLLDVYLHRLPARFLTPGRGDLAEQVGELARGMGEEDALLVFPEGGNFTAARRLRAIAALRRLGRHGEAGLAETLHHVLPPRTGGVLAALAAAPHADVVFVAHTGLEQLSTARGLWRGIPLGAEVRMRWWFHPAASVPVGAERQSAWLFERWADIDRWLAEQHR